MSTPWFVYIVQCADNTLYTGVTVDLEKRTHEHNHSKLGAKYTRNRRPVSLVYHEEAENRSAACKREAEIKGLSREEKQKLFQSK